MFLLTVSLCLVFNYAIAQDQVYAAFDLQPSKIQVMSMPFYGGKLNTLSESDYPVIFTNNTVAFIKSGQV